MSGHVRHLSKCRTFGNRSDISLDSPTTTSTTAYYFYMLVLQTVTSIPGRGILDSICGTWLSVMAYSGHHGDCKH
jgi:hypothetical protein